MDVLEALDRQIQEYLPDLCVKNDVPMSKHTSFRIGGGAKRMAFPVSGEQVVLLTAFAEECGAPVLLLGNGTNLLAADEGLACMVINMERLDSVMPCGKTAIKAQAGASLSRVASAACAAGLTGLEFAHGIPGSVGGGVCMNAGAYGGELAQVINTVELLIPHEGIRRLTAEEMHFGYRHSLLHEKPDAVVLSATFALQKGNTTDIRQKMNELMERRKTSQPLEFASAGSTFKRPTGYFAGALIEQAGCKGLSVGDAQVSEKHAGFIINRGQATCRDVLTLIEQVERRVEENSGVRLETEVKIVK